jgi:hypothetical protein
MSIHFVVCGGSSAYVLVQNLVSYDEGRTYSLIVYESGMQGRIFGPKREVMARGWGNLQRIS